MDNKPRGEPGSEIIISLSDMDPQSTEPLFSHLETKWMLIYSLSAIIPARLSGKLHLDPLRLLATSSWQLQAEMDLLALQGACSSSIIMMPMSHPILPTM